MKAFMVDRFPPSSTRRAQPRKIDPVRERERERDFLARECFRGDREFPTRIQEIIFVTSVIICSDDPSFNIFFRLFLFLFLFFFPFFFLTKKIREI
jgi:hypothetical protein